METEHEADDGSVWLIEWDEPPWMLYSDGLWRQSPDQPGLMINDPEEMFGDE